ncbi:MAG: dihydroorotase family protein [Candidatus Nezhaarchaeota archaeon]|nr:dihydroorotase family protein [Candidatus Nezhaarchaeota archaeon]
MPLDLVIKGGRVFYRGALVEAALGVEGGRVAKVSKEALMPRAEQVFNAEGLLVLPGMVDIHVHLRDPGRVDEEDFASGTAAAACGGVTAVADMPNNRPPIVDQASFKLKQRAAASKAYVDYALYVAMSPRYFKELPQLLELGAVGVKAYMAHPSPELRATYRLVEEGLRRFQGLVAVHAEDPRLLERRLSRVEVLDATTYAKARGSVVEAAAVRRVLKALPGSVGRLHLCHLSSAPSVKLVEEAKSRGASLSAETCPHYLLLTKRELRRLGTLCKVDPPVRAGHHRRALWRALWSRVVDAVASDHAPHRLEERETSFYEAPSGFAGVEIALSLLLDCVNRGLLSISDVVELYSRRPASLLRLRGKGGLEEGFDADVAIVSMSEELKVRSSNLHSKSPETPFEGRVLRGRPVATFVRGRLVAEGGEVKAEPGWGLFLRPGVGAWGSRGGT